jgi:hypothetical protein
MPAIPVPITALLSGCGDVKESNGILGAFFCLIAGTNLPYAMKRKADQCVGEARQAGTSVLGIEQEL